jgi:hypothetical protein
MVKITRRLPSPAMVVAVIALFVALGGTGYAASTLVHAPRTAKKHRKAKPKPKAKPTATDDTAADNGLITSRAPGLSVAFAKSAGSADSATSASTADHATNADHSSSADHASSADSATNATNASHASSADSATSAGHATSADSATTASTAGALGSVAYRVSSPFTARACGTNPCGGTFSDSTATETCPAGTVVIAGGVHTSGGGIEVSDSHPTHTTGSPTPNQWFAAVDNYTDLDGTFTVYAVCISAAAVDNPGNV